MVVQTEALFDGKSAVLGTIRRIDRDHTAPKAAWMAMGMPQWPTPKQNQEIFSASIMRKVTRCALF